jgi:hypothetical protein
MRVSCLLFVTIGCGLFMPGTCLVAVSYAAPQQASPQGPVRTASERSTEAGPGRATPTGETKPSASSTASGKKTGSHRVSNASHAPSHIGVTNANHPKQFPNSQGRLSAKNPRGLTQPDLSRSGVGMKNGLSKDKTASTAPAVRSSSFPSSTSSLHNVHHRGPNPAVVGGPATSRTGKTVALNGTHMNRRP